MITAGDFRNGITFEINGEPHVVISFQHVKPGKALRSYAPSTETF